MAKEFIKDAAHALLMAFRFTQAAHRTNDLPIVLIPVAAWPEFVKEAWRETGPIDAVNQPRDGRYVTMFGIRFRPDSVSDRAPATPLTPDADHWLPEEGVLEAWHATAGGEKHTPGPTIMFGRPKVDA